MSVEDNYIPNVVWRKMAGHRIRRREGSGGGGALHVLQVVANAQWGKATSIRDGTADQVYSKAPPLRLPAAATGSS